MSEGALPKQDAVLRVDDLQKSFGGLAATDHASFAVERGTITGLIGPNGAGKSTLFNLISGFYEPDGGTVEVNGTDVTGMEPYQVADHGLIRDVPDPSQAGGDDRPRGDVGRAPEPARRVLYQAVRHAGAVGESESANLAEAERILEDFEIDHLAAQPATDISGGQMKLVELARAMLAEPEVLLLDEPVAGVNPTLAKKLKDQIRRLNDQGTTFLLIEHDMEFVMDLADPIVVLDQGHVLTEGTPEGSEATIALSTRTSEAAHERRHHPARRGHRPSRSRALAVERRQWVRRGAGARRLLGPARSGRDRLSRRPERGRKIDRPQDGVRDVDAVDGDGDVPRPRYRRNGARRDRPRGSATSLRPTTCSAR